MKFAAMTPAETEAVDRLRVAFNGIPEGFRVSRDEDWTDGSCITRLRVSRPSGPHRWTLVAVIESPSLD